MQANRPARFVAGERVRPGDRAGLLSDRAVGGYAGMLAVLKLHAACYRGQIISQAIGSAPDPMAARHYPCAAWARHPPPPCPARRHGAAAAGAPVP